ADHFIYQRNDLGLSASLVPAPGMMYDSEDVLHTNGTWGPGPVSSACTTSPWTPTIGPTSNPCIISSPSGYYTTCGGSGEMVEVTFRARNTCGSPVIVEFVTIDMPTGSNSEPVNSPAANVIRS